MNANYSQSGNRNVGDRRIRKRSGQKLEAKMSRNTATEVITQESVVQEDHKNWSKFV